MKTLHTEVGIGAPAHIVWDIISDVDGWSAWNPMMKGSGKLGLGERLHIVVTGPGGKAMSLDPIIETLEVGREFRWRVRKLLGLFDAEHGFRVVPEDVGRCRFEQFEVFGGLLGSAMYTRQAKALDTGFQAMNRMLKRTAEKRARELA